MCSAKAVQVANGAIVLTLCVPAQRGASSRSRTGSVLRTLRWSSCIHGAPSISDVLWISTAVVPTAVLARVIGVQRSAVQGDR